MISNARQWLRDELAADREAIAAKSPTDWLVTIVDIVVGPALALRAVLASWIWAINHGESAKVGLSFADPAIIAPAWGRVGAAQVAALLVIVPALFRELPLCCAAIPPGVGAYLGLQGLAVAIEGAVVVTGVRL